MGIVLPELKRFGCLRRLVTMTNNRLLLPGDSFSAHDGP
jgi:hypothetical protein